MALFLAVAVLWWWVGVRSRSGSPSCIYRAAGHLPEHCHEPHRRHGHTTLHTQENKDHEADWIGRHQGWFNIKMPSYQYRKSHCGDKTVRRPSYLHNGISYTGKTNIFVLNQGPWALWSQYTIWLVQKWCNSCPDLIELHFFFYHSAIELMYAVSQGQPHGYIPLEYAPRGQCNRWNSNASALEFHLIVLTSALEFHPFGTTCNHWPVVWRPHDSIHTGFVEEKNLPNGDTWWHNGFPKWVTQSPTELYIDMHPVCGMTDSLRPMSYIIITTKDESRVFCGIPVIFRLVYDANSPLLLGVDVWIFREKLGQYHTCWYTDHWCCQGISSHGIYCVKCLGFFFFFLI